MATLIIHLSLAPAANLPDPPRPSAARARDTLAHFERHAGLPVCEQQRIWREAAQTLRTARHSTLPAPRRRADGDAA